LGKHAFFSFVPTGYVDQPLLSKLTIRQEKDIESVYSYKVFSLFSCKTSSFLHAMNARSQTEANCKIHTIKENYAWNALLLCLNLLGDFKSSVADELLRRDLNVWYRHILIGRKRLRNLHLPSHLQGKSQEDLQILPLLHELYNIFGGTTDQRD
jgi:hypothetical protein